MAELIFGSYRLQVDAERTRAWYEGRPRPWITCECAGCRNYVKAVKRIPAWYGIFCRIWAWTRQGRENCAITREARTVSPAAAFQMERNHPLPWVLEEPNPYIDEGRPNESPRQEKET